MPKELPSPLTFEQPASPMMPQFRRLALSKQGLAGAQPFGHGLSGTLRAIEHLGYVQIDTLSVVERAHHHVLWSRVPGYDPAYLNQLVAGQQVFEYWYHAASFLPMRDYRYALWQMESVRNGEHRQFNNVDKRLIKEIMARVTAEGPLRLRDLDKGTKGKGAWWNYGPGRRAVEKLFMQGDLTVCARNGMEKVYDLTERCIPEGTDLTVPTPTEYATYLLDTTMRAHGVFMWKQLLHLKSGKSLRDAMREVLDASIEAGSISALGKAGPPFAYVDSRALDENTTIHSTVKVLSPFDNVVIHRDRLNKLFEFDYRIECYVPASKRVFGYFCLPILYGDRFVGRIDCKAHRAEQRFEVLNLHLEDARLDRDQFFPELSRELRKFADFNRCAVLDDSAVYRV